jgi:hypothetical protein
VSTKLLVSVASISIVLAGLTGTVAVKSSFAATIYQVPPSIAADCSIDVTQPILSWIASVPDNSVVSFGTGACYRIEATLEMTGRNGLTFEGNGSTFRSFNPPQDQRAIWRVIGSTNFVFRNMTVYGSYTNGGVLDATLQHAHAFDFRGTSAEVANTKALNMSGDCVYFGLGYDNVTRSSGSYHDSSCSSIGRNAVSMTAANNVLVQYVTTSLIGYTAFDIEPNVGTYTDSAGWGTSSVTVTNNTIGGSYYLYAFAVIENAPNINDSFTNNKVSGGQGLRIGMVAPGGTVRPRNVTITGNTSGTATWSPAIEAHNVDGLTVTSNTVPMTGGAMATVDTSCTVNVTGNSYPGGTSETTITPYSGCSSSDTTPPTVTITSPSGGSTVVGRVSIAATGTDNVSVVKMEIYVDSVLLATSTTGTISTKWNVRSTSIAFGTHTITVKAYDASNNTGSSTITVSK